MAYDNLMLAAGGQRFAVSNPERGDVTLRLLPRDRQVPADASKITFGVAISALKALWGMGQVPARLETQGGAPVLDLELEKVDPRFSVVVARLKDAGH